MSAWVKAAASFFYVGYLPFAPGTFGSLAGLLIAWYFYGAIPYLTLVLCVVGFAICKSATIVFSSKPRVSSRGTSAEAVDGLVASRDPTPFVLDEVCGMMLSVLWLPKTPAVFLVAFILFRLLDTLKPWPISRIQKNANPLSIVWDDLAAGALVNLILQGLILTLGVPV